MHSYHTHRIGLMRGRVGILLFDLCGPKDKYMYCVESSAIYYQIRVFIIRFFTPPPPPFVLYGVLGGGRGEGIILVINYKKNAHREEALNVHA
jgi:hypothetical protein